VTQRTAPTTADSVSYTYDLLGRVRSASYGGRGAASVTYTYDKAGRVLSTTSGGRTVGYQYDAAGNRTRTTWPDSAFFVTYDYDALNRVAAVKENGTTLLASYGYDDLSRRTSTTYANGTSITYGHDNQARLSSQSYDLAGTSADLTRTFGHNQAGEITALTTTNAAYDWNGHYNINRPYTVDHEERYLTSGAKSITYDRRGNLTGDGTWTATICSTG
jgi:YD repeat-containing protein